MNTAKRLALTICISVLLGGCVPVSGMDFAWGNDYEKPRPGVDGPKEVIWMVGEIVEGDFEKLRNFVAKNHDDYIASDRLVYVTSNGGNLLEAMMISNLLKAMYARVRVDVGDQCLSACFFIYAGSVDRSAFHETLGVHRSYFERKYYSSLSAGDAEKRQVELTRIATAFLTSNAVPRPIIDIMTRTPSTEIRLLSAEEIGSLGHYAPWYEELLIARCDYKGSRKEADAFWGEKNRERAWDEINRRRKCEDKFVQVDLRTNLKRTLETSPTAPPNKENKPAPTPEKKGR